ncbi:MAG TPA: DUF5317 domain-containing protein [Candidatus Limnocylindria bacterium]|nr:DUF5317 domain-containing protein [Candidatus Limnocylindria bacterium]
MLLLYAVAAGLLIGLLLGGRVGALGAARFRWWPVALGGLVFQLFLFMPPLADIVGAVGPALYVGSTAIVLLALLLNLGQPGFRLIALGALLNFAVISLNGGQMPASPEAFAALTGLAAVPVDHFTNSQLIGPGTVLPWLGDIFLLPRPLPLANVFSVGDVLIGLGGAIFVVRCMRRPLAVPGATGHRLSVPAAQHG